jgi:D-alanyl-lipoteichoic acid acyltransferase DltB (MBOAT superfamily)
MGAIDLYAPQFWWFVLAALLLMVPQANASARKWTFAGLNLVFLALHVLPGQMRAFPEVVAGLLLAWAMLRWAARPGSGRWSVLLGGLAVLGIFAIHKLPHVGARLGASQAESILATVGFSYVALRLVDVARAVREGRHPAPDLPSTINYLLPFHMIAAGPIQSYDQFAAQPGVPAPLTASRSLVALERVALGLFKKFILANYIDRIFLTGFQAPMPYFFFEVQMNYIWLYLDFSAYSDVAVGLGTLMGVAAPENFRRPYLARNVIEYWERWHISLSQFIGRNLFLPIQVAVVRLTDSRAPMLATSLGLTVSFLLCGLWHSVSWPWFAWGVCQAAGLVACNYYKQGLQKRLGRKGVKAYLANRWIKVVAVVLTFEFSAAVVAVATYPYGEIRWWTEYPN